MFAAVDMTSADALITVWRAKYRYGFWRPITAVNLADSDGNPATTADPNWVPLVVTPAYPEYPSGYNVLTAAFTGLRMGELIALRCLAAHGDIVATTNLRKEWSAGTIIAGLSALHPEFYPAPLKEETVSPGRKYFTAINSGYLTKPELLALNGLCGNVLHRGSMKKLLSSAKPPQLSLSDVAAAVNKLQTLLSIHTTLLVDGNTILICTMKNIQNNDKVQVALGTRDQPIVQTFA